MSAAAEAKFDEMSEWVVTELAQARGDLEAEDRVLAEAARRYVDARREVDPDDPGAYAGHFYGADGVAFEKKRTPGFQRIAGATPDELQRWAERVADLANGLSS